MYFFDMCEKAGKSIIVKRREYNLVLQLNRFTGFSIVSWLICHSLLSHYPMFFLFLVQKTIRPTLWQDQGLDRLIIVDLNASSCLTKKKISQLRKDLSISEQASATFFHQPKHTHVLETPYFGWILKKRNFLKAISSCICEV